MHAILFSISKATIMQTIKQFEFSLSSVHGPKLDEMSVVCSRILPLGFYSLSVSTITIVLEDKKKKE